MSETKVAQIESHEYPNGSIESKWEVSLSGKRYPVTLWGMPTDGERSWSYMTSYLREEGAAHGFASSEAALDHIVARLEHLHRPLAHRLFGKRHAPRRQVHTLPNGHVPHAPVAAKQQLSKVSEGD
jgi:hypothetical protein